MKLLESHIPQLFDLLQLDQKNFKKFLDLVQKADHLCCDSRTLTKKNLFIAYRGVKYDGHDYVKTNLQNSSCLGALVNPTFSRYPVIESRLVRISNLDKKSAKLAKLFYGHPSSKMRVVAITGTDGKTSTVEILTQVYRKLGFPSNRIGTLGLEANQKFNIQHTTPNAIDLQRIFFEFVRQKIKVVVMEASSHGLEQGRLDELEFDSVLWSNLTPEHLDYHHDIEHYFKSKLKLLSLLEKSQKPNKHAVICLDSFFANRQLKTFKKVIEKTTEEHHYQTFFLIRKDMLKRLLEEKIEKNLVAYSMNYLKSKMASSFKLFCRGATFNLETNLIGHFNGQNIALAAIEILESPFFKNSSKKDIFTKLSKILAQFHIQGRLEKFPPDSSDSSKNANSFWKDKLIYIDYAHTSKALEKTLECLQEVYGDRIICLFGCGGDRDKSKRKEMGKIACRLARHAIITSDNPRTEEPLSIMQEIKKGWLIEKRNLAKKNKKVNREMSFIVNRREAIQSALSILEKKQKNKFVLLLAGKGHEDYQIIGEKKYPFDERVILKELGEQ